MNLEYTTILDRYIIDWTMNLCTYCTSAGVATPYDIFLCSSRKCHDLFAIEPYNNAVCCLFKDNAPELEFMIKTTFAAAKSPRWNMILNPFPWFYKTQDQHDDTELGTAVVGADINALLHCIESIDVNALMDMLSYRVKDDEHLIRIIGDESYRLIKWIVETKSIDTEFAELRFGTKQVLKQFKIRHATDKEAEFMKGDSSFLLHGSDIANWHSIIRNGIFNASNTKLMTAGAAYGPGVYLSDTLTISNSYSRGSVDNTSNMVVAVFQVKGEKKTYHKGGPIYVVPDASNLLLRYLINVPRNVNLTDLSKILEERFIHTHTAEMKMVVKVNQRQLMRIEQDLKLLNKAQWIRHITKHSNELYVVNTKVQNIQFGIRYTSDYPFEPPIIWVRSPKILIDAVLPSGVLANPVLCRSGWHAKNTPYAIIDSLLSCIGQDLVVEGQYDDTLAVADAMLLR